MVLRDDLLFYMFTADENFYQLRKSDTYLTVGTVSQYPSPILLGVSAISRECHYNKGHREGEDHRDHVIIQIFCHLWRFDLRALC